MIVDLNMHPMIGMMWFLITLFNIWVVQYRMARRFDELNERINRIYERIDNIHERLD